MRALSALVAVVLHAVPSAAQPIDEPLPRIVADVHGMWGGLPSSVGWVPDVPANTPIPNRGFGVSVGAHLYPLRFGILTFGVGASAILGQGKGNPSEVISAGSSSAVGPIALPVVTTKTASLVPQLSINFGHRFGWSYLSAGYGPTRINSTAAAVGTSPVVSAPDIWNPALNFGGGARWFMKRHLGASFDVRFIKLSSRATTATAAGAKRTQIINLLVGVSLQ
ncbi:MAG: hypothetical protein ACRD2A_01355 [Vicinamibacterales bacterium]